MGIQIVGGLIHRKCDECKRTLVIDRNNSTNCILFDGKAFCYNCFIKSCTRKAVNPRAKKVWREALEDLDRIESETKSSIQKTYLRDDIFNYMLKMYDVTFIPSKIFTKLAAIDDGTYVGLGRAIPLQEFFAMWKDYQTNLDETARQYAHRNNKTLDWPNRINYDIAILVGKYDTWKAKKKAAQVEMEQQIQKEKERQAKIKAKRNYRLPSKRKEKSPEMDELLDDIF